MRELNPKEVGMQRGILAFFLILVSAVSAHAQITLTNDDFFDVGDFYRTNASPGGQVVTVLGAIGPGGQNDWDFTVYGGTLTRDLRYDYVDPSDGGFGGETIFPDADFAQKLTVELTADIVGYLYGRQEAAGRRIYGIYQPGLSPQPEIVHTPPGLDYPTPINFGDVWTVDTVYDQVLDVLGSPTATQSDIHVDASCDGWGTITLPDLGTVPCLRVQELTTVDVSADILGGGTLFYLDTITFRSYAWFAPGMDEVARITSEQFSTTVPPTGIPAIQFTQASAFQVQFENSGATEAPAIDPIADELLTTTANPYSLQVTATGQPAPVFSLLTAPTGMTVGGLSGLIEWTPTPADLGPHTVTVVATNGSGSDSTSYQLTVINADEPPLNLSAPFVSSGDVTLTWDPPATTTLLLSYEVRHASAAGGPFTMVGAVGGATTTFTHTGATPGAGNHYVVVAILDAAGFDTPSDPSNSAFSYLLLATETIVSHDDASAETGLVVAGLNSEMAVSFELPSTSEYALTKVAVYIEEYVGAAITLKAYDDDAGVQPGSSLVQLNYLPGDIGPGWNILSIQPEFLQPTFTGGGSFFVGVVEGATNNAIGIDDSAFGNSWTKAFGGAWSFLSSGEIMIRAIIDGDPSSGGPQFIRGDSNTDGGFDIADAIYTLAFLFSSGPQLCLVAMDANNDDAADIGDAIYTLDALFTGGPTPSAPYPGCGTDPGPLPCDSFASCP